MKASIAKAHTGLSKKTAALRALSSGDTHLEDVLRAPYEPLEHVDVWPVLLRTKGLGRKGAKRICIESGVFPHKQLVELTDQERQALLAALPKRARKEDPTQPHEG